MSTTARSIEMGSAQLLIRYYDQNDEVALTEFFLKFKDLAFRIAYNIIGNQADADDVMQKTFIQIIKKQSICKAAYDLQDDKVKSWLLTIVYNFSRMQLRSQKLKRTYSLDEDNIHQHPDKNSLSEETVSEKSEESNKLKNAIFNLPEKYRTPILMRYHEDMSIEEISNTLSSNPGTIRSILSRGINLLRNKLSPENIMLSSTAAIELVNKVSYPISQKIISVDYIKNCATAKTTSAKLMVTKASKIPIMLKSIAAMIIVASIATWAYFDFNNSKEIKPDILAPNAQNNSANNNIETQKLSWDFSLENGSDLKTSNNNIAYDSELNAITNAKDGVKEQSIINLGFNYGNYTKIHSKGKMLLKEFTTEKPINNFALDFAPLKNNKPIPGLIIYKTNKPINLPNLKVIPYEQDIYIVDDTIIRIGKGHGCLNIMRFDNLNSEVEIGLLLSGMYVEIIKIEKMNPTLIQEIKKTIADILNKNKSIPNN